MELRNPYAYAAFAVFYAIILVALICAKLLGHIHWSWWLVTSMIWGPIVAVIVIAVIAIALLGGAQSRGENPFQ